MHSERAEMPAWQDDSVDGLLQLLHWQHTHGLAGWASWLLLQLHVQDTTKLELAVLLELGCRELEVGADGALHLLWLQLSGLGNLGKGCSCSQACSTCCLHGFHGLHCRCHVEQEN